MTALTDEELQERIRQAYGTELLRVPLTQVQGARRRARRRWTVATAGLAAAAAALVFAVPWPGGSGQLSASALQKECAQRWNERQGGALPELALSARTAAGRINVYADERVAYVCGGTEPGIADEAPHLIEGGPPLQPGHFWAASLTGVDGVYLLGRLPRLASKVTMRTNPVYVGGGYFLIVAPRSELVGAVLEATGGDTPQAVRLDESLSGAFENLAGKAACDQHVVQVTHDTAGLPAAERGVLPQRQAWTIVGQYQAWAYATDHAIFVCDSFGGAASTSAWVVEEPGDTLPFGTKLQPWSVGFAAFNWAAGTAPSDAGSLAAELSNGRIVRASVFNGFFLVAWGGAGIEMRRLVADNGTSWGN